MAIDPQKFVVDPKKATKEDLERAMELLSREKYHKARVEAGEIKGTGVKKYSEMSEAQKATARKANARRLARQTLVVQKAIKAGIVVTEAEVDEYLKSKA